MNWRSVTVAVIIGVVLGMIGWDIFVIFKAGKVSSISQVVIDAAHDTPIVAFAAGVLCGHLFWRMPDLKEKE